MTAAPVRVIVHAGFHKTGTTSLQDFFSLNKTALAPHLAYYGKMDFFNAGAQARIYAQRPFPHRLLRFRRSFRKFLNSIPDHDVIVLSRETFSGGMPGHHTVSNRLMTSYGQPAKRLGNTIIRELRRRFGPDVNITFFYSTRARAPWLASIHGHLLRSIRMTDDLESFTARFSEGLSPECEAAALARALAPVPVVTAALEDSARRPEGPAAALLDLVDLPSELRSSLSPVPPKNTANTGALQAEFLRLNREIKDKIELKKRKEALLRSAS